MDIDGGDGAVDPRVLDLVRAAGAPAPVGSPLPGEEGALAAFRQHLGGRRTGRRRRRLVVAGATAGLVLTGATAAAAATGSLPDPAQRLAHDVLDTVGVSVPDAVESQERPSSPGLERRPTVPPAQDGDLPPGLEQAPGAGAGPVAPPATVPPARPAQRPAAAATAPPTQAPPAVPGAQPVRPTPQAPESRPRPTRPTQPTQPAQPQPPDEPQATPGARPTTTPSARPDPSRPAGSVRQQSTITPPQQ